MGVEGNNRRRHTTLVDEAVLWVERARSRAAVRDEGHDAEQGQQPPVVHIRRWMRRGGWSRGHGMPCPY